MPPPPKPISGRRPTLRLPRVNWRAAVLTVAILANLGLGGWFAFDRAFLQDLPVVPDKEALWRARKTAPAGTG